nr:hypothetical protein [Tanacetum cinerariifolium]
RLLRERLTGCKQPLRIRCNFLVEPYQSSFCFARNMRIPAIVLHHR